MNEIYFATFVYFFTQYAVRLRGKAFVSQFQLNKTLPRVIYILWRVENIHISQSCLLTSRAGKYLSLHVSCFIHFYWFFHVLILLFIPKKRVVSVVCWGLFFVLNNNTKILTQIYINNKVIYIVYDFKIIKIIYFKLDICLCLYNYID